MVATVVILRLTSATASPLLTPITSINTRANAYDSHSVADTLRPIQIPAAGENYSYWVTTRLFASTSPTTAINNLKWYQSTTAFGVGVSCMVASAGNNATSGYVMATGTSGTTGAEMTTGAHSGLYATASDSSAFTAAAPMALTGSLNAASSGVFGDCVVYQIRVGTTAGPGATATRGHAFFYDES